MPGRTSTLQVIMLATLRVFLTENGHTINFDALLLSEIIRMIYSPTAGQFYVDLC